MSTWLAVFEGAMQRNEPNNRLALATATFEGTPSVRTIILRGVTAQGVLFFVTDARSRKVEHLLEQPEVALVAWYPHTQEQFRFTGRAEAHDSHESGPWAATRQQLWLSLNEVDRAAFLGPPPGRSFVPPHPVELPELAPPEFVLITVAPTEVDYLKLGPPHHRLHHRLLGQAWVEERLVP